MAEDFTELTEERIQHVLAVWPALLEHARQNDTPFNKPPELGQPGVGFFEAMAPQMNKLYAGIDDDAASVFRDHSRMIDIWGILQRGGVDAELMRMRAMGGNEFLNNMVARMESAGAGNPGAVRDMLPQMKQNAEIRVKQIESITPAEVELVGRYSEQIARSITVRGKP